LHITDPTPLVPVISAAQQPSFKFREAQEYLLLREDCSREKQESVHTSAYKLQDSANELLAF